MSEVDITLFIESDMIGSDFITQRINATPITYFSKGDKRLTPSGRPIGGIWPNTIWASTLSRFSVKGVDGKSHLSGQLKLVIQCLYKRRHSVRDVTTRSSSAILVIRADNDWLFGFILEDKFLQLLAELKISLGVEIFGK